MSISTYYIESLKTSGKEFTDEHIRLLNLLCNSELDEFNNLRPDDDLNKKFGTSKIAFFKQLGESSILFALEFRDDGIEFFQIPRFTDEKKYSDISIADCPHNGIWASVLKEESGYAYRLNFVDENSIVSVQNLPFVNKKFKVSIAPVTDSESPRDVYPDKDYSCYLDEDHDSDYYSLKDETTGDVLTVFPKAYEKNIFYCMHHIGSTMNRYYRESSTLSSGNSRI